MCPVRTVIEKSGSPWYSPLKRCRTRFTRTDTDNLLKIGDENFAITDLAGVGATGNRVYDLVNQVIIDTDFKFHLGQEIDHVLRTPIKFGMPLLAPKTFHLYNSQSLHADLSECLANVIELEGLDYRCNDFHK